MSLSTTEFCCTRSAADSLEQALDRGDQVGRVALLDDEAVLPGVDERVTFAAPHVDDLVRDGVVAVESDDALRVRHEERRRTVSEVGLQG